MLETNEHGSTPQATHKYSEEAALGPDAYEHGSHNVCTSPNLPPSIDHKADSSDLVYTETKVSSSLITPVLPAADEVVYHEVKGYKNEQVIVVCVCFYNIHVYGRIHGCIPFVC